MSNEGKLVKIHYTGTLDDGRNSIPPTITVNPSPSPAWQVM